MSLAWIQQFVSARARGFYAFLFVGSVSDGFPVDEDKESGTDDLHPWYDTLSASLNLSGTEHLLWQFDLARGFVFPQPKNGERFATLLFGEESAKQSNDPISAARAAMRPARQLPTQPHEALGAMLTVFTACLTSEKSPKCVAVLPDIDAYFVMQNPTSEEAALAIQRLCENDAFARAGHMVIMSASSIASLPERLRRVSGPICLIDVNPPNASERESFLRRMCLPEDQEQRQRGIKEAIAKETSRLMGEVRSQISDQEQALARVREQASNTLQRDKDWIKLNALCVSKQDELTRAEQEYAQTTSDRRKRLENERDALRRSFETGGENALAPLTQETWRTLKDGDKIILGDSADSEWLVVLRAPNEPAYDAHLSRRNSMDQQAMFGTKPALFILVDGQLAIRSGTSTTVLPTSRKAGTFRVERLASLTAGERLSDIIAELDNLSADAPKQVTSVREHVQELVTARSGREKLLTERNAQELSLMETRVTDLRKKLQNPASEELTRLNSELAMLSVKKGTTSRPRFDTPPMGFGELVRLCANLGYRDIRAILRSARALGKALSHEMVVQQRVELLRTSYGHLLDIVEPPYGFESIANLYGAKRYLQMVSARMKAGDTARVPMGCTLVGPPGTGKSALATALAKEAGLLLVRPRTTQEKWVGSSERNVADLHRALFQLAPVIVFRDEIDQEDGGREGFSGDSGVSNRTRQAWMTFLSDPAIRGRVFVVSATNRPDLVDTALMRGGRSDDIIPILMPDESTREALFGVMVRRYGFKTDVTDFGELAKTTQRISGADIEVVVQRADRHSNGVITLEDFRWAIGDYIPQNQQREIARMTLLAIQNARSRDLLPENVAEEVAWAQSVLNEHGQANANGAEAAPPRRGTQRN